MKKIFIKSEPKSHMNEATGVETSIPGVDTCYGKKFTIGNDEKSRLMESLTPREREAGLLLLEGFTLKETAKQLNIGYSTANTYQTAIYRKLHVNSRAELIINYREIAVEDKNRQ